MLILLSFFSSLFSQRFYCIGCADAWSICMQNWRIHCSMHCPYHALHLVSWPFGTFTIWAIHQFQTFIHYIHGWAWWPWDYLHCNFCSDFSREYFSHQASWQSPSMRFNLVNFHHFLFVCRGWNRFLVCLCCEKATYGCRSAMIPVHASIGLATFMLAIATCIAGLTEKTLWTLR